MQTNIFRYRKRDLPSPDWIKKQFVRAALTLLVGLVLVDDIAGQQAWEVQGSKAKVEFLIVSEHLGGASAKRLTSLDNTIDLNAYPDAEILIRVDAEELANRHNFYICSACYRNNLPGLNFIDKMNTTLRNTDEHAYLRYKVSPSSSSVTAQLMLTIKYRRGSNTIAEQYFSQPYTVIPRNESLPAEPLANSGSASEPETSAESERRAAAERFWQQNRLSGDRQYQRYKDNSSQLRKLRDDYYQYARTYKGLFPERDRQAAAAVTKIVERLKYLIGKEQQSTAAVEPIPPNTQPDEINDQPSAIEPRDRPLSVAFTEREDGGVVIEAAGGQPPYSVQLYDKSGTTYLTTLAGLPWQPTDDGQQIAELAADPGPEISEQVTANTYTIRISDSHGTRSKTRARYSLNPSFWQRVGPWLALAAILLGTPLLFVLINLSQKDFGA